MKFLLDADLSPRLITLFTAAGHDALHVSDVLPPRTPDSAVAAQAREMDRCVVTGDYDFADLRDFEPRRYPGIIVLATKSGTSDS